ncbi:ribosomal-protein-alanine N-acetyltransferase [Alkalihalobacillus xiaoxiensis]|uniref:Ribosomal-protein-alanine N-acetyltransferase n=1 Tax=Shouchella xiaoxiensis TaxID=766895 RepID=A0ABS2T213_9BACI|nr:GNAT family N-acetyltransferase [Shouchella xiaoxiensis]MBM7841301.1 ribosomal-protein-alanine N-acetyltransferase [Shouchella xiaoxiensis]
MFVIILSRRQIDLVEKNDDINLEEKSMRIRTVEKKDAEAFYQFQVKLDQEAEYMLYEPNERITTVRQIKKTIKDIKKMETSTIFIAEEGNRIIGYVGIYGSSLRRVKHVGYISIGIIEAYCNKGIGYQLLTSSIQFAEETELKRLELSVIEENKRAIHLYQKCGFVLEGVRKKAVRINKQWHDEFYMAKIL